MKTIISTKDRLRIETIGDLTAAVTSLRPDALEHYTRAEVRHAVAEERSERYEDHDAADLEALTDRVVALLARDVS